MKRKHIKIIAFIIAVVLSLAAAFSVYADDATEIGPFSVEEESTEEITEPETVAEEITKPETEEESVPEAETEDTMALMGDVSVDTSDVTLYGISSSYEEYISIPAEMPISHQITVSNASNVYYYVQSGYTATVSTTGLISVKYTTWYWYGGFGTTSPPAEGQTPTSIVSDCEFGDTVIKVIADGQTFTITVHVVDYATYYVDSVMQAYIDENITESMSGYEKLVAIAQFIASYDYSASSSSCNSMIIRGGGDCWASTDTVIRMCTMLGIDSWSRNGNKDPGAGSGHMNAMAYIEDTDTYYEIEAGYSGTAPRYYSVHARSSLFSYSSVTGGVRIYQYDGKTKSGILDIPSCIDGKDVIALADNCFSSTSFSEFILPDTLTTIGDFAFSGCSSLTSLHIPANVSFIGEGTIYNTPALDDLTIDPANNYYVLENGILYTKDKTAVVAVQTTYTGTSLLLGDSVTSINGYAARGITSLVEVTLPANVTSVGEGAFGECRNMVRFDAKNSSLTSMGAFVFYYCSKLKELTLPLSLTSVDTNTFYNCSSVTDIYYEGTAEQWAASSIYETVTNAFPNAIVHYGNCTQHSLTEIPAQAATCTADGTKEYWECSVCGRCFADAAGTTEITDLASWKTGEGKIPATGHTEEVVPAVPATCTEPGLTEGKKCSVCGEILTAQQTIPALGHDLVHHDGKDATCTEAGWAEYDTCSRCDYTTYVEIPALGHTEETLAGVPATCTELGLTEGKKCSVCGEILIVQETILALGHDIVHHDAKPATCTEIGWKAYDTCSRCDHTTYVEIPAIGHTEVVMPAVPATCTETGLTEGKKCSVCGEIIVAQEEIPALGHNYENGVCTKCGAVQPKDGWKMTDDGIWYYYTNGVAATGWKKVGSTWYLFNDDGQMLTGWQKVGGVWYYMDEDGNMLTGWQKVGGVWYYFKDGGQMVTGWQKIGGTWYFFKSSGAMVTGWQKIGGTWYFFAGSGAMVTGWYKDGSTWYYFKSSGAMAANEWCEGYWLNSDGSWTYQPKGSWKQDSTGWWFGDTSGWYAKNATVKIDNVNYKFNAAGYWVK